MALPAPTPPRRGRKERTSFCEQKKQKNFISSLGPGSCHTPRESKFFYFFFAHKKEDSRFSKLISIMTMLALVVTVVVTYIPKTS
jgi:hypothetical protein